MIAVNLTTEGITADQPSRALEASSVGQPWPPSSDDKVVNISGNYPHLTVFNSSGECGIGAIAPWAGKLWFITYPPHRPEGSDDKLYTVDPRLKLEIRPESVGGTHASRFIHRESGQLILGPYFIDTNGKVRVPDMKQLRARLTATTRHLGDPANKVYSFGMERELFEVDVRSLAVTRIYGEFGGLFPGYHGKGAYVSQGRLVVANNGEAGWSFAKDSHFDGPAGCLAENTGTDWKADWPVVERKNFCEVTGPGGLVGNSPDDDRLWATGWDKRSVILKLFEQGRWHTFRLPKASYSHDALHGWYTEWPRIRELQPSRLLMHMHGMFWDFPKTFSAGNTAGLRPISTYLKMPVDYCWWNNQIVMARDDASIMQNELAGQSHSSPWFGQWSDLEKHGTPGGWGGPWVDDAVKSGQPSEPYLVAAFTKGVLHLRHASEKPLRFTLEADAEGRGAWRKIDSVTVPARGYRWWLLPASLNAIWLRLTPDRDAIGVTAYFHLGNPPTKPDPVLFQSLADMGASAAVIDGVIKPAQGDARTLLFAAKAAPERRLHAADAPGLQTGFYQMDGRLRLDRVENPDREKVLRSKYGVGSPDFTVDAASVIVTEGTNRFRLPKTDPAYDRGFASGWPRGRREVVTERFLFNAHGTFYELPRSDAGGIRRLRPVATHRKHISDFCRWRGLLVLAGTTSDARPDGHFIRSEEGRGGLWLGDVDDLWRLGTANGMGGPWKETAVRAGAASDPYLMTGYDQKMLEISHDQPSPVTFVVEVDFLADGSWSEYARLIVRPEQTLKHIFPDGYSAHWARLRVDHAARVTALFTYGPP